MDTKLDAKKQFLCDLLDNRFTVFAMILLNFLLLMLGHIKITFSVTKMKKSA